MSSPAVLPWGLPCGFTTASMSLTKWPLPASQLRVTGAHHQGLWGLASRLIVIEARSQMRVLCAYPRLSIMEPDRSAIPYTEPRGQVRFKTKMIHAYIYFIK